MSSTFYVALFCFPAKEKKQDGSVTTITIIPKYTKKRYHIQYLHLLGAYMEGTTQ